MPIYEYQCQACGHQLEAIQKFSDAPLTECPECKAGVLQKLMSASGFQLKGSGWYVTDYSAKGKKPKSEDSGSSSSGSSDSSGSSSGGSSSNGSSNQSAE